MKKDRNTFFENSSMNMAFQGPAPMMQQPMMPMNAQAQAQASQSFYSNTLPMMMPTMTSSNYNDSTISELESRMAKLERNMNRLENRLNKIEGSTYYTTDTSIDTSSSGMYMV